MSGFSRTRYLENNSGCLSVNSGVTRFSVPLQKSDLMTIT